MKNSYTRARGISSSYSKSCKSKKELDDFIKEWKSNNKIRTGEKAVISIAITNANAKCENIIKEVNSKITNL